MPDQTKPKVLVISPVRPLPLVSGNRQRVFSCCKALQENGYDIHFVWYAYDYGGRVPNHDMQQMSEAFEQFHVVPATEERAPDQHDLDSAWTSHLEAMIRWCLQNNDYDILWVNYVTYSKAFELIEHLPTVGVLDTHDVLSNRRTMLKENGLKQQFFSVSKADEAQGIQRADIVVSIQKQEAEIFRALGHQNVLTLGFRPVEEHQALIVRRAEFPDSLIVGVIGSANNIVIECTERFLVALKKLGLLVKGSVEVVIAGGMSSAFSSETDDGVTIMGPINQLDEFYSSVDLVVIPNSFGTGLKIKAVEALSFGVPVVATAHSFIGIPTSSHFHLAKSEEELAHLIASVVHDRSLVADLRHLSQDLYQTYSLETSVQMGELLSMVGKIKTTRNAPFPVVSRYQDLELSRDIILFGHSEFAESMLAHMPEEVRSKVTYVIDSFKPSDLRHDPPVLNIKDLDKYATRDETVILAIHPLGWLRICFDVRDKGFADVRITEMKLPEKSQ